MKATVLPYLDQFQSSFGETSQRADDMLQRAPRSSGLSPMTRLTAAATALVLVASTVSPARASSRRKLSEIDNISAPGVSDVLHWWCGPQGHAHEPLCARRAGAIGAAAWESELSDALRDDAYERERRLKEIGARWAHREPDRLVRRWEGARLIGKEAARTRDTAAKQKGAWVPRPGPDSQSAIGPGSWSKPLRPVLFHEP